MPSWGARVYRLHRSLSLEVVLAAGYYVTGCLVILTF